MASPPTSSGSALNLTSAAGITSVIEGPWIKKNSPSCSCHVALTGTGALTATVLVQVSNGPTDSPIPLDGVAATVTLSGTNSCADGFLFTNAPWLYVRLKVTSLTGVAAKVTGLIGT